MSTYHILLFGICRDLLKSSTISIEKEGSVTVEEMLQTLRSKHPALDNLRCDLRRNIASQNLILSYLKRWKLP